MTKTFTAVRMMHAGNAWYVSGTYNIKTHAFKATRIEGDVSSLPNILAAIRAWGKEQARVISRITIKT